ncbi:MAG: hypothetical protein ACXWML_04105, partial [Candidatus Binataceae bacterium]
MRTAFFDAEKIETRKRRREKTTGASSLAPRLIPPPRQEGEEVSSIVFADGRRRTSLARLRLLGCVLAVSLGFVIARANPARA